MTRKLRGAGRHRAQGPQPHLPAPSSGFGSPASSRRLLRPPRLFTRLDLRARLRLRPRSTQTARPASSVVLLRRSSFSAFARTPPLATGLCSSLSSATPGASSDIVTLTFLNRHDRTWDRSGRVTAVLPNNAYYVLLDGSRRVTQRTRAHIKPIAIFPLHAGDVFSGRLRPGAPSDAPVVAQPRVFPVPATADASDGPETPPVEPAHAPEISNDVPIKIKRHVDGAPTRSSSSSPIFRQRGRHAHSATVSQPAPRPPVTS